MFFTEFFINYEQGGQGFEGEAKRNIYRVQEKALEKTEQDVGSAKFISGDFSDKKVKTACYKAGKDVNPQAAARKNQLAAKSADNGNALKVNDHSLML